jgi:DNA-binding beta-propeller fold protein YncE
MDAAGAKIFVTGTGYTNNGDHARVEIVAYAAADGQRLWASVFHSGDGSDAKSVAVGSRRVVVAGVALDAPYTWHVGSVAFDAVTGAVLWSSVYGRGIAHEIGGVYPMTALISGDGATAYVVATTGEPSNAYTAVAFDAATGHRRWAAHFLAPGPGVAQAAGAVLADHGARLVVTGYQPLTGSTMAFDTASGQVAWTADSPLGTAIAGSPDGSTVFVVAHPRDGSWIVIGFDAKTGRELWRSPLNLSFWLQTVAVSPDGTRVYAVGSDQGEWRLYAYDAATGTGGQIGSYAYGQEFEPQSACSLSVSRDSDSVFVTGQVGNPAVWKTVAFSATSGRPTWSRTLASVPGDAGPGSCDSLTVAPDGGRLFVTAASERDTVDYKTVSYEL